MVTQTNGENKPNFEVFTLMNLSAKYTKDFLNKPKYLLKLVLVRKLRSKPNAK